jgi:hypothetical protein
LNAKEKLEEIKKMIDELGGRRSLLPMANVLDKIEIMLKGNLRRMKSNFKIKYILRLVWMTEV